ncbi:hypothetical protein KP509_04G043000 [Ceratopteris richardii]|nr:hypothetical protein KP509_04G043000 [Ceratopteris richardii]
MGGLGKSNFTDRMEKHSKIYSALAKHNPSGRNVDAKHKTLASEECGCSVQEVEEALYFFEVYKKLGVKMAKTFKSKDELPKTVDGMKKMLEDMSSELDLPQSKISESGQVEPRQTSELGRNAPCSCGSGKKFKRCCGKSI